MGDGTVGVKQAASPDRLVDNETVTIAGSTVYRQRVQPITRPMTPLSSSKTGPLTDDILVAVTAGQRLRLLKNAGHCDPALSSGTYPTATLKLGATTIWTDKLEAGLPWNEAVCFEGGDGEDLTFDLTTTATVFLNLRYELLA